MPITFHINSSSKVVQSKATGIVGYVDLVEHLEAKEELAVHSFAEIFDARNVKLDLSIGDLLRIAAQVRRVLNNEEPGCTAVVTNSNFIRGLAQAYAKMTVEDNPAFEVFTDIEEANAWVHEQTHAMNKRNYFAAQ